MTDWDQLREVGHDVAPPPFESLVGTAGRRDRRARAITATAAVALLVGLGIAVGLPDDDTAEIQPVAPATESTETDGPADDTLPEGVLPLPEPEPGEDHATLSEGRYRVPLSDSLAFDIDVPEGTSAHEDGLYLAKERIIIKTEVAGEEYGVPRDPCTDQTIEPTGPTVDDLVRELRDLPVYEVSRPEPVELGDAAGTYLEARIPAGFDASPCEDGQVQLPANTGTAVNAPPPYIGRWWVLDVDGTRVVVQQNCWRCTAAQVDRDTRPGTIGFAITG
ncbi:hypothetical protein [Nocardioides pelophilus]|uniref:hypothetical protein n=1 Tax=Nocardioides pelophilus TaxID=2172019 RepID=UPI001602B811|nr:hypothetical protein [Nocardioides pelophilus]